jgi:uncharacterized membrane protein SirB2
MTPEQATQLLRLVTDINHTLALLTGVIIVGVFLFAIRWIMRGE